MRPLEPPFREANYRALLRQIWPHRHTSLVARMNTRKLIGKSRTQNKLDRP